MMKRVIIETPYAGTSRWRVIAFFQRVRNRKYARAAVRDSLMQGESPIASHLLYTQPGILRDEIAGERQQGIDAGLAWCAVTEATVVYADRGISKGMTFGIEVAKASGIPVEYRTLSGKSRWAVTKEGPAKPATRPACALNAAKARACSSPIYPRLTTPRLILCPSCDEPHSAGSTIYRLRSDPALFAQTGSRTRARPARCCYQRQLIRHWYRFVESAGRVPTYPLKPWRKPASANCKQRFLEGVSWTMAT